MSVSTKSASVKSAKSVASKAPKAARKPRTISTLLVDEWAETAKPAVPVSVVPAAELELPVVESPVLPLAVAAIDSPSTAPASEKLQASEQPERLPALRNEAVSVALYAVVLVMVLFKILLAIGCFGFAVARKLAMVAGNTFKNIVLPALIARQKPRHFDSSIYAPIFEEVERL